MCFYVDPFRKKIAHLAKEDIICYKLICRKIYENDYRGVFIPSFIYQFNTVMKIKDKLKVINNQIHEGFHSYYSIDDIHLKTYLKTKGTGYRCRSKVNHEIHVPVRCVIPKGSRYYKNDNVKEFVSDALIIKEILYREQ